LITTRVNFIAWKGGNNGAARPNGLLHDNMNNGGSSWYRDGALGLPFWERGRRTTVFEKKKLATMMIHLGLESLTFTSGVVAGSVDTTLGCLSCRIITHGVVCVSVCQLCCIGEKKDFQIIHFIPHLSLLLTPSPIQNKKGKTGRG